MDLFIGTVVSGLIVGLIYGMLGFSAGILYRSSGILSFAQPMIATFLAFIAHFLVADYGMSVWGAALALLPVSALIGWLLYWGVFRVGDKYGNFNLVMRTLALFLLIQQFISYRWSRGEPFTFPRLLNGPSLSLPGGVLVDRQSLAILAGMAILLIAVLYFFARTGTGLLLRSVAESPENALTLGVKTRRLSALAWSIATIVCLVVAILNAPDTLVSTEMFSPFVLLAFTALLVGGLYSWSGAVVGGLLIGVANSLLTVYANHEVATLAIFGVLILVLLVKPNGLIGTATAERF